MKNIKRLFIFLSLFFNTSLCFAQKIICEEMDFFLEPTPEVDSKKETEILGLQVKATLKITNFRNDTIALKTNVKTSLLGPKNIVAKLINKKRDLSTLTSWIDFKTDSKSVEDYQIIKIIVPQKKKVRILITYNVFGSSLLKYKPDNMDFFACQQQHEYFYPMNIKIKKIKISSPHNIKSFASYKIKKNTVENINLSFINKKHYIEKSINECSLKINTYIPDTLRNNKDFLEKNKDLQKHMKKLSNYLFQEKKSNIIYINWRDEKSRRAFGEAMGNNIICDIKFSSKDLLHEIIHTFLPSEVEQFSKGEYFIKESIIEWLALFLSNKIVKTDTLNAKSSTKLYDCHINNHTTWDLIYKTGPAIIQQVASKYGEERMASLIISFLEKNSNKIINYNKFTTYLNKYLSNNLSKEIDYFVK